MAVINFNYKLDSNWNDFTHVDVKPSGFSENAQISTKTRNQNFRTIVKNKEYVVAGLDYVLYIDKSESWNVTGTETIPFLAHEQGHYDITAIGARELYAGLFTLKGSDIHDLSDKIKDLLQSNQEKLNLKTKNYDVQTKHGDDSGSQQLWESKISATKLNPNGVLNDLP